MRGLRTEAAVLALGRDEPEAVPARPSAGDRIRFTCDRCGTETEVLVEGGAPEPGEVLEATCEVIEVEGVKRGCGAVGPVQVRVAMFG